jgi:ADP-ribose pyrophosphatase YjhB (NUDIX family)
MPYVPPHLRKTVSPPRAVSPRRTPQNRFKAMVVPKVGNKYVVFRYTGSKDLLFPGGGCGPRQNLRNCALKELREESKNSIRANKSNLKNLFYFKNKNRSPKELNKNKVEGVNVTMHYHGYLLDLKNFDNIKKRYSEFNMSKVPNRNKKAYSETNKVKLKSLENLEGRLWLGKKILPHLKSTKV